MSREATERYDELVAAGPIEDVYPVPPEEYERRKRARDKKAEK